MACKRGCPAQGTIPDAGNSESDRPCGSPTAGRHPVRNSTGRSARRVRPPCGPRPFGSVSGRVRLFPAETSRRSAGSGQRDESVAKSDHRQASRQGDFFRREDERGISARDCTDAPDTIRTRVHGMREPGFFVCPGGFHGRKGAAGPDSGVSIKNCSLPKYRMIRFEVSGRPSCNFWAC